MRYARLSERGEQLDRAGQWTALREQLAVQRAMALLDSLSLGVAQRPAHLAGDGPG